MQKYVFIMMYFYYFYNYNEMNLLYTTKQDFLFNKKKSTQMRKLTTYNTLLVK